MRRFRLKVDACDGVGVAVAGSLVTYRLAGLS
jgi:hypothetical protein